MEHSCRLFQLSFACFINKHPDAFKLQGISFNFFLCELYLDLMLFRKIYFRKRESSYEKSFFQETTQAET